MKAGRRKVSPPPSLAARRPHHGGVLEAPCSRRSNRSGGGPGFRVAPGQVCLAHGRCPDRRVTGDGRWEMGDGRWEMGDGRWEMGDGRWEMGDGRWESGVGRSRANDEVRLFSETAMIHCPGGGDGGFSGPRGGSPDRAAAHAAAPGGRPQVIDIPRGIAALVAPRQAVAAADAMFHGGLRWNETGGGWNKSPGTWNKSAGSWNENRAFWDAPGTGFRRPDAHSRVSPVGCTSIDETRTRTRIVQCGASCPALPE
jgi:hypothetical protein